MRTLVVGICMFVFALAAFGQTDRGTITGTVSDATNAVIPGVNVVAINAQTGARYETISTETGNYTLGQLPSGTYQLTAELPGFKRFARPGIIVQVAQVIRVDINLEIGAATETVTVEVAAPLLRTESGEVSHNISTETLDSLPVLTLGAGAGLGNIRNPLQSVTLLPGASFSNENTLRINGMPSSSHTIRIDGQDATNGLWRQQNQAVQPSIDAMQEVAIQTGNFDAEYGQAGGGYFNYTMKSGTNSFHGGASTYFVNEAFNAGTPFTDRITLGDTARAGQHQRNTQRRNDWGFFVGGPIAQNRSFFFFNFEQFRESQFITTGITTVPTEAYRRGDFSAALGPQLTIGGQPAVDPLGRPVFQNAIYDPATTRTAPDGSFIRDAFPGNVIPPGRLDAVALKVQGMLPTPTSGGLVNNYTIPGYTNFRHTTIPSFKIDHNFDERNKMSFFFSVNRTRSPNANGFEQPFTPAAPTASNSYTTRVNYDRTISSTTLLHLGAGLLYTFVPSVPPDFDQSQLGWAQNFYINKFPNIAGLNDPQRGGNNVGLGSGFMYTYSKDLKPTGNVTLSWVKGNHSFKAGGDLVVEGIPTQNSTRANGVLTFSGIQSSIGSWQDGRGLNSTTGFPYSSFLLGRSDALSVSALTTARLGNHSFAFYMQDSWKVTRKLTLNYGLRYDYATLLREQYGRMQSAAFDQPNPLLNNRLGSVIYEATCNCRFNRNYPWAFGPRLSMAYQFADKWVLRAGGGIAYGTTPNNAFLSLSVPDFYTFTRPAYGEPATLLADGNPFGPGNRFGNPPIVWPDFAPHYPLETAPGFRPPQSPFISIDRNAGRLPRITQWSIGLQREITGNLLVEAAYVGNRGVWWTAPLLAAKNYNALTPEGLRSQYGLDITNAADRALLLTPISSPQVLARFPSLRDPNSVYPGFPAGQPLNQALRPFPQWNGIPPFLGPPLGNTWYDSLQAKVTQRFSHGLTAGVAYTWQKELTNGANSDTSYLTPNPPLINDVFDRKSTKQISSFGRPHMLVVSFNYLTPGINAQSTGMNVLSKIVKDWVFGGVLRYQSGEVIRVPGSNNGLLTQLARGAANNPALWGGGNTFFNRVSGQPYFLKDPNCRCINPHSDLVLNPAAWTDAAPGTFGTSAPYYNDYRWQRQPSEALSIGRTFRLAKEDRVTFNIRAEFQNVFNRLFLASPSVGGPVNVNPLTPPTRNPAGQLTGGYGWVNWVAGGNTPMAPTAGARPRTGQIVARLTF